MRSASFALLIFLYPYDLSHLWPEHTQLWIMNCELSHSRSSYCLFPLVAILGFISPRMVATLWDKKKTPKYLLLRRLHLIEGGYLLSHFRTTIGVTGFNFSVRNGKRWNPRAITTLVSSVKEMYTLMPSACVGFPRRIRLEKEFLEASLSGWTANLLSLLMQDCVSLVVLRLLAFF